MHKMTAVIVNCFDTYEPRVILLKDFLEAHQYKVNIITSDFRHIHKAYRDETLSNFTFIPVKSYKKNLSLKRFVSHYCFARDSFKVVEGIQPELLWVLAPPNYLVKRSAQYKKKNQKTTLIIDLIDMWPEALPFPKILKMVFPLSSWKSLRDSYLCHADQVVTECNLYQTKIRLAYKDKIMHTLYLAKNMTINSPIPVLDENKLSLCYLGSINNIIDIDAIGELVKNICNFSIKVDFHIIGDGEKKTTLLKCLNSAGANVQYHGKIFDEKEKQKIFNTCQFGINIMKQSVFVGLTMKTLDYFAAGLPIINNLHGDTWSLIEELNLGINLENGYSIKEIVGFNTLQAREQIQAFFKQELSIESFNKKVQSILGI